MVYLILSILAGYLIGSIPTAYLLVHWKTGKDIRSAGSGNVGALNAYEVTGSRPLGLIVMACDALKGAAAVGLPALLSWGFAAVAIGGIAAVLGHNHSPWIGFRGGRGLATAAGAMLAVSWVVLVVWGLLWCIAKVAAGNIHAANAAALILAPFVVLLLPVPLAGPLAAGAGNPAIAEFAGAVCLLGLIRHVRPLLDLVESKKSSQTDARVP